MDLFALDLIETALSTVVSGVTSAFALVTSEEYLPFTMTVLLVGCISLYKWRRSQPVVDT